jgi:hypothetical protein
MSEESDKKTLSLSFRRIFRMMLSAELAPAGLAPIAFRQTRERLIY